VALNGANKKRTAAGKSTAADNSATSVELAQMRRSSARRQKRPPPHRERAWIACEEIARRTRRQGKASTGAEKPKAVGTVEATLDEDEQSSNGAATAAATLNDKFFRWQVVKSAAATTAQPRAAPTHMRRQRQQQRQCQRNKLQQQQQAQPNNTEGFAITPRQRRPTSWQPKLQQQRWLANCKRTLQARRRKWQQGAHVEQGNNKTNRATTECGTQAAS